MRTLHFSDLTIAGAKIIDPDVFRDERGYFKEVYSQAKYAPAGISLQFVQDNVSVSDAGVLRGLHYDVRMAKLVQCLSGTIYDVIADMREDSPTYKQWEAVELSDANHRQIYIPAGCAHGFYVLHGPATVMYKQTAIHDPAHERTVRYDDPTIGVRWPLSGTPVLSAKDANA